MKRFALPGLAIAAVAAGIIAMSNADGQAPAAPGDIARKAAQVPRQPGGLLADRLGEYTTIEGALVEGGKVETNTLLVDTVNGHALAKPVPVVVKGYVIVRHNLRETNFRIEPEQRYVLKGYEDGSMIGVAPAVREAAKEEGWREIPVSPLSWTWRPYFAALIVDEPAGVELTAQ